MWCSPKNQHQSASIITNQHQSNAMAMNAQNLKKARGPGRAKKKAHQICRQSAENALKLFFGILDIVRGGLHHLRQLQKFHFVRNLCELCEDLKHVWQIPFHCNLHWCIRSPLSALLSAIREGRRVNPKQSRVEDSRLEI